MKLVCIREGRVDTHVGDVFEIPDPPEGEPVAFDLNFYSHIDSDKSKAVLAERAAAEKADDDEAKADENKPDEKPEEKPATPVLGDDDAMNEGAK